MKKAGHKRLHTLNCSNRKRIRGCQGLGRGAGDCLQRSTGELFSVMEMFYNLNCGGGYITVYIFKIHRTVHIKW